MANYDIVEKKAFTVLGIGVELKSEYTDQKGLDQEKEEFFNRALQDGTLEKLKTVANNDYIFAVNEAVDDKMMHYIGVETEDELPEATRMIPFPEGKYIVIPGEANSEYELADELTQTTFGDVLYTEMEYAYVGGPNTAVIMDEKEGTFTGEMWIPVEKQ